MQNIIIIGSGGHANSCLDVIISSKKYKVKGYISEKKNKILSKKIKWLGNDNYFQKLNQNDNVIIGFANIGKKNLKRRIKIFELLKKCGCKFPVIKSKYSYVSKHAKIGDGTIIMHDVVINTDVEIGMNCIINSKALIEHDTKVGNHTHISTGVIINGNCKILDKSFVGTGSVIFNNVKCKKKIIKAGNILKK